MTRVGLISDTHGLLREAALAALAGSDLLLHAGDVGSAEVLAAIARLGEVHAVRGNTDAGEWARELPPHLTVTVDEAVILLHHGHLPLPEGLAEGAGVVVQGHSHRPSVERNGDQLLVNPGSAGRRRFRLPVTVALLEVEGKDVEARIVELAV